MTIPYVLAIDPALTCSGWAFFENERLNAAGVVATSSRWPMADRITALARELYARGYGGANSIVSEWPEVYEQGDADPNKLLYMPAVVGAVLAKIGYGNVVLVAPKLWKGQVPKPIHNARMLKRLDGAELAVLERAQIPASQLNNAIDAIGLGLWLTKRIAHAVGSFTPAPFVPSRRRAPRPRGL